MPELTATRRGKIILLVIALVSYTVLVVSVTAHATAAAKPATTNTITHSVFDVWNVTRAMFLKDYEAQHGAVDDDTDTWLFSNAHRMCWWLDEQPRLPSEALTYGTDELGMSADQTITVTELGMQYIEGCPDYNPRKS